MTQKIDIATWRFKPWAGTLDQLMRAARLCAKKVAEDAPYPHDHGEDSVRYGSESYTASSEADAARRIAVVVVEAEGFQRNLSAIEDLEEIRAEHLGRVTLIEIEVGILGFSSCSASIRVTRQSGMEVAISGRDRSWTAGLKHEVHELLLPTKRLRPRGLDDVLYVRRASFLVLGALVAGSFYVSFGNAIEKGSSLRLGASIAFAIATLAVFFVVFLAEKLPMMELLTQGREPMYQRWRTGILAATGALTIGVGGSIIATIIWP